MAQTELSAITDEGINISGKFQSYKQPSVLAGKSGMLVTYGNDRGMRSANQIGSVCQTA